MRDLLYYTLSQSIAHLVLVDGGTPLLRAQMISYEVVHLLPQILISWLEKNETGQFNKYHFSSSRKIPSEFTHCGSTWSIQVFMF